jgi:hypothetical protein
MTVTPLTMELASLNNIITGDQSWVVTWSVIVSTSLVLVPEWVTRRLDTGSGNRTLEYLESL